MRKIEESGVLLEFLDKRLKNVEFRAVNRNSWNYEFTVPGNTDINPNDFDVRFDVNFNANEKIYPTNLGHSMKIVGATLTFKNNVTGMRTFDSMGFEDLSPTIVLSTIAGVVNHFFTQVRTASHVMGVNFTPAHSGLVKVYNILSKEASRRSNLVWTTPENKNGPWYLVKKSVFDDFKRRIEKLNRGVN